MVRSKSYPVLFLAALFLLCIGQSGFAKEIRISKAEASSFKEWGSPDFLVDGDRSTAWVGGRRGVGPGKKLSFAFAEPVTISRIVIANGNQGEGEFKRFRCITSGVLVLTESAVHHFTLKPEPGEQSIVFPPVTVSSFEIIVSEVSKPSATPKLGADKVAVSEVRAFSGTDTGSMPAVAKPSAIQAKPVSQESTSAAYFSATKPGRLYLLAMVPVSSDTSPESGEVHPEARQEFVDLIRAYFDRLATVKDGYADLFTASIRQRELDALRRFREELRSMKRLDVYAGSKPDFAGLNFEKPIVRGDSAMLRVRGACRLVSGGKIYGVPVNAFFSFVREDGGWRINGVQKR